MTYSYMGALSSSTYAAAKETVSLATRPIDRLNQIIWHTVGGPGSRAEQLIGSQLRQTADRIAKVAPFAISAYLSPAIFVSFFCICTMATKLQTIEIPILDQLFEALNQPIFPNEQVQAPQQPQHTVIPRSRHRNNCTFTEHRPR